MRTAARLFATHGHRSSSISNFGYRKSWHLEVVVANSRSTCYKTKVPPRRVKVKQIQLTFIKIPLEKYAVIDPLILRYNYNFNYAKVFI